MADYPTQEELDEMKLAELRKLATLYGLSTSGNTNTVRARVEDWIAAAAETTPPTPPKEGPEEEEDLKDAQKEGPEDDLKDDTEEEVEEEDHYAMWRTMIEEGATLVRLKNSPFIQRIDIPIEHGGRARANSMYGSNVDVFLNDELK